MARYRYPDGADCVDSLEADRVAAGQPGVPPYVWFWQVRAGVDSPIPGEIGIAAALLQGSDARDGRDDTEHAGATVEWASGETARGNVSDFISGKWVFGVCESTGI